MDNLNIANTKILLVEDNPRYLKALHSGLERFGYKHINTARNSEEAIEKLDESFFEIIVADMRLDGDVGGGFVVFEEVQKRNITAVVIILTANDTVADCRRAHRMGAWDYISKSMKGDVFKELHESIQAALTYLNRWGNYKDGKWIEDNADTLQEKYPNKYIAVINNAVMVSADTEEALKKQLNELKLPLFLPVIKKIKAKAMPSIVELIEQGESATLEFKETFQYDGTKQKNENLRLATLKTIVGFLNAEGGKLLIGVKDNKEICGLEDDFSLFKKDKAPTDFFEQTLTNLICQRIGKPFIPHIKINFEKIDDKQICVVAVNKTIPNQIAFYKWKNENIFFVRVNCTTQKIVDSKEFYDYICRIQNICGIQNDDKSPAIVRWIKKLFT